MSAVDIECWTYEPATLARVRAAAEQHGEVVVVLVALLRAYAFHSGGEGDQIFPGLRLLSEELGMSPKRISRLRDVLIAGGLLADTGALLADLDEVDGR